MAGQETRSIAFILSLIAGVLVLVSGVMFLVMGAAFMTGMMGWYYQGTMGMMGYRGGYPNVPGFMSSLMALFGVAGIVCGIVILIGAYMLNSRPGSHGTWGTVILIFSVISLVEGGGYIIGAVLGIVGGILAITRSPAPGQGGAGDPE